MKEALALAPLAFVLLAGCEDQSMRRQRKYTTYSAAGLWRDNAEARPLPQGVVAQGDRARAEAISTPPDVDAALVARGRQRFDIYCSPCHGATGFGDGMIVQRGFPPPPSFHDERLRAAPAQHFFDVITHGFGVMYSYAARVEPRDRWAIVAYVRALQLSQRATLAQAPDAIEKLP